MSISQNYPTIAPSLSLDFANTKVLDPRITFARASVGTYYDANGVLQTASANVARFDHNPVTGESFGLLMEEQRTNLVLRSEEFDNAYWVKSRVTITDNTIFAPDGTLSGDKLVETTDTGVHSVYTPVFSSGSNTFSIYVKKSERDFISLETDSGNTLTYFDISTGTVGTKGSAVTAAIVPVGNGWYRCSISGTLSGRVYIQLSPANNTKSYTGDGYSGVYIWGAQLEAGAFPTSYISTSASQVTRSADSASITGANFSEWYRQDEGTVYAEAVPRQMSAGYHAIASFADATASETNFISIGLNGASTGVNRALILVGGGLQANFESGAYVAGVGNKQSLAYKVNDIAYSFNGVTALTDTSAILPTTIQLFLGQSAANNISRFSGTIKKLSYYPARLTNEQLQALTS